MNTVDYDKKTYELAEYLAIKLNSKILPTLSLQSQIWVIESYLPVAEEILGRFCLERK